MTRVRVSEHEDRLIEIAQCKEQGGEGEHSFRGRWDNMKRTNTCICKDIKERMRYKKYLEKLWLKFLKLSERHNFTVGRGGALWSSSSGN